MKVKKRESESGSARGSKVLQGSHIMNASGSTRGSKVLQGSHIMSSPGSTGSHIMNAPGILWSAPPVHISGGRHWKARSLVWSRLFLLSGGPEVVWWWLLLIKSHSWALSLTASSVVSSLSLLCLVSLSLGAILWPSGLLSFCVCFLILTHMVMLILGWISSIFKDCCGYYCS